MSQVQDLRFAYSNSRSSYSDVLRSDYLELLAGSVTIAGRKVASPIIGDEPSSAAIGGEAGGCGCGHAKGAFSLYDKVKVHHVCASGHVLCGHCCCSPSVSAMGSCYP